MIDLMPVEALNHRVLAELNTRQIDFDADSSATDSYIIDAVIDQNLISQSEAKSLLESVTGFPAIDPILISFSEQFLQQMALLLSREYIAQVCVFPIKHDGKYLHLVMANPLHEEVVTQIEVLSGSSVIRYCCNAANIRAAIDEFYPDNEIDGSFDDFDRIALLAERQASSHYNDRVNDILPLINHPYVIHLFRLIISVSSESGISDIHLESQKDDFLIRIRQDGVLRIAWNLPLVLSKAIIGRIKQLADMDLDCEDRPQDGRISSNLVFGKEIDIRVSVLPGVYGEKVVLRLLDKGKNQLSLSDLNLEQNIRQRVLEAIERPNGMMLVTGPTGSGKTTTLYAVLAHLNHVGVNICTAEDPVEYDLKGITQVSCTERDNVTFADALKSFLRQDPDIIMVGEIRDLETADIAAKAALTGHLMLSTLHTNDAASTVTRLMNIGVPPFILVACNLTVVAQRLLRKVCEHCRVQYQPSEQELHSIGLTHVNSDAVFYLGQGCEQCAGTGYKGRVAILEVLTVDKTMERLILEGKGVAEIQEAAVNAGMKTLYQEAIQRLQQGVTTIAEVLRVTVKS